MSVVSTGTMIYEYLDANGFTIDDLYKASGVSYRTIFRVVTAQESKLPYKIAEGVNRLIPEISVSFLMKYDAEYQLERRNMARGIGVKDINDIIKEYKLDKLYKESKNDKVGLVSVAERIFGKDNIANNYRIDVDNLEFSFSRASNPDDRSSLLWLKAAYEECKERLEPKVFDRFKFVEMFDMIKALSGVADINTALFNMSYICQVCGINFYYRPSIPGSRVKAVAVRDKGGFYYILVSDLFKCVENLWLAFVHEMIHIYKDDFEKVDNIKNEKVMENENYVEEAVIFYFIQTDRYLVKTCDVDTVNKLASEHSIPINIAAEIVRFLTNTYGDVTINKLIHYYKSDETDLNAFF